MGILTELDKSDKKAMKWLAAEYSYVNDLANDIKLLEKDLIVTESGFRKGRSISSIMKDLKYIGRSEYKFERTYAEIEEELQLLVKRCPSELRK
ncbi:MAG TPA: hypothetical protein VJH88_03955 [Candidatus Nanoarchaeia archaeon]|nr:hypothetical protein [Candidatus Nanoarchaeia archaeon]